MVSALWNFLRKYFRGALATSAYYLPIAKNSWENFCGKLKNCEYRESLAQRIFPRLRYIWRKCSLVYQAQWQNHKIILTMDNLLYTYVGKVLLLLASRLYGIDSWSITLHRKISTHIQVLHIQSLQWWICWKHCSVSKKIAYKCFLFAEMLGYKLNHLQLFNHLGKCKLTHEQQCNS